MSTAEYNPAADALSEFKIMLEDIIKQVKLLLDPPGEFQIVKAAQKCLDAPKLNKALVKKVYEALGKFIDDHNDVIHENEGLRNVVEGMCGIEDTMKEIFNI
ncbi:hypothetical protein MMC25_007333 [Agyrium rufum]|nr:hypothetical protein [Agyrium rufum]